MAKIESHPQIVNSKNKSIDWEFLEKSRELLRKLRENGVKKKEYDLASPYGGRWGR